MISLQVISGLTHQLESVDRKVQSGNGSKFHRMSSVITSDMI